MKAQWMLLAALMAFTAVGCGQKNSRDSVRNRGRDTYGTGRSGGQYGSASGSAWSGVIMSNDQRLFQEATELFVPENIRMGSVSGQPGQSTGVRFQGCVSSSSGYGSGGLEVLIWDSIASREGGGIVSSMRLVNMNGSPDYGNVTLSFEDNHGLLVLEGTVYGDVFSGQAWFDVPWANEEWNWGQFSIPARDFFNCRY